MRRIEKLGIELAYALRERDSRRQLWEHADAQVRRLEAGILEASTTADTGSQPVVPPEDTVIMRHRLGEEPLYECPGQGTCYLAGQVHAHDERGAIIWSR